MRNPDAGKLRSPAMLCNQQQVDDPNGPGQIITYVDRQRIYCGVEADMAAYLNGQQVEIGAVTHRVTMRWRDLMVLNQFAFVIRERVRTDGTLYTEIFKIHRVQEVGGRERFVELAVELVKHVDTCP